MSTRLAPVALVALALTACDGDSSPSEPRPSPPNVTVAFVASPALAAHEEAIRELMGTPVPPWCNALSEGEIGTYLELARAELDDPGYDHDAWFFGSGSRVPRWTGYTLGYRLVAEYLAAHSGTSAANLVGTPAEAFRPD